MNKKIITLISIFVVVMLVGAFVVLSKNVDKKSREEIFGTPGQTGNSCYLHVDQYEAIVGWHYAPSYDGFLKNLTFKTADTWNVGIFVQGALYEYTSEPIYNPPFTDNNITGLIAVTEIVYVPNGHTNQNVTLNFDKDIKITAETQYYMMIRCVNNLFDGECFIHQGTLAHAGWNHLYGYKSTPYQFTDSITGLHVNSQYVWLYGAYFATGKI